MEEGEIVFSFFILLNGAETETSENGRPMGSYTVVGCGRKLPLLKDANLAQW